MSFPARIVNSRMETFKQACIERGVKVTHQRLEIYRALASSETHPDAETIYRCVRKRIPTISHDTVYRNLKLLSDYGLIAVAGTSNERLRFDANMERHHHFVCVQCGLIRDFCSEQLESIQCPPEARVFGTPVSLHFEVKGVCTKCGSRTRNKD